jgi:predicted RecA/RadA family phage recombinase
MANIATARDSSKNLRTLKHTHSAALAVGEVLIYNGQVLVACNASAADAENVFVYRGRVELDKTAALAINPGDVVYWDDTAKEANKTASANTKAGICVEAALAADATVLVMLGENK